jgi:hypothetical protein
MNGKNTGPEGAGSAEDARAALAAMSVSLGRFQAPELWFSQDLAFNGQALNVPRPMPLNRPAESVVIALRYRITVANNNMTTVVPEAPATLLQQILLNGVHRQFANLTPIKMSGATAFVWPQMFQGVSCDLIINGVRVADADRPFVSGFLGNVGTYDVVQVWNVPLVPTCGIGQSLKRDSTQYLYQPADWGDTLQLQLNFGDTTVLGTPNAAGDVTITAFNSAVGTPNVSIFVNYSILGPFANIPDSGVVVRQERTYTGLVTAGNALRIDQLQKQITSNLVLKSGTSQAGITNGGAAFATLVDTMLNRTQIAVDNKPVKFNQDNLVMKAYLQRQFATVMPAGYFVLSFTEGQNPLLSYRGDGLAGGSAFEANTDVLTTGATQVLNMTQEMIYGGPFPALRPL